MDDEANGTWLRTAATWLAGISIVLVLVNAALELRNQAAQRAVNQRQQFINQSVQIGRVSQVLIETVAKSAVASKDDALTALMERHGIHVNVSPAPAGEKKP